MTLIKIKKAEWLISMSYGTLSRSGLLNNFFGNGKLPEKIMTELKSNLTVLTEQTKLLLK